jgi:hypothetical protein
LAVIFVLHEVLGGAVLHRLYLAPCSLVLGLSSTRHRAGWGFGAPMKAGTAELGIQPVKFTLA